MLESCPTCGHNNVVQNVSWDEVSKDLQMRVVCLNCGLKGPTYTFGKQGKEYSFEAFNRAERLSVYHWNAEAHRS